jgi:hypothetical protein
MRKALYLPLVLAFALFLQFCSSSKKAASTTAAVTYEANIQPVVMSSCSPCHIPGKGNKKPLDTYTAVSSTVDDIITRIQKNPGEKGFMPAMHPKLPDSTINAFIAWKQGGLLEK